MPLEQYDNQITLYGTLWTKISGSLYPQFEHRLWLDLHYKLRIELGKETLGYTLKEELEHQCQCL